MCFVKIFFFFINYGTRSRGTGRPILDRFFISFLRVSFLTSPRRPSIHVSFGSAFNKKSNPRRTAGCTGEKAVVSESFHDRVMNDLDVVLASVFNCIVVVVN